MSVPPDNDFLTAKSDAELLFLVQNPTYYHPDLVQTARRELQRRSVPWAAAPAAGTPPDLVAFAEEPPERRWLVPALGGGLVALALGVFFLRTGATPPPAPARPAPPAALVAVETHLLPSFEGLTASQLRKMPAALPPGEQADTTARRKYLLLARRYWEAENQSAYLYEQALLGKASPALPGQVETTLDKWHRLTSALVYDHQLQPGMTARLELMEQAAAVRIQNLQGMSEQVGYGNFPLNDDLVFLNDSVQYLRQVLLGVPVARRQRPVRGHRTFTDGTPEVRELPQLPEARPQHNPLYVIDGHPFPSDASTGEAPAAVRRLSPDSIANIVVLKEKAAVGLYGPRAHDGAVVIVTRHPAQAVKGGWKTKTIRIF
ncbi:hypothetical protein [Hymenobacter algoricola]|uniref:TonB-dependent receptor plug domain-containing protein n=1 Tax=Hymenobacter algoricola TaxID=486267 RepID=A0ABP7M8Q9_9BACT